MQAQIITERLPARASTRSDRIGVWVFLAILPWTAFQFFTSINADTLWLMICAGRLLDGQAMASGFYDNNPPLSVLLYVPPVALGRTGIMDGIATLYFYMAVLTVLSVTGLQALLGKLDLSGLQRGSLLAAFMLSITVLPSIGYTERDQILYMGLAPLVFLQLARSWNVRIDGRLTAAIALAGGVAILLKPAFLLIPAALQLHRIAIRRSWRSFFQFETSIVAACTVGYAAVTVLLFRDYVTVILPDVVALYLPNAAPGATVAQLIDLALPLILLLTLERKDSPLRGQARRVMLACYGVAMLCLVPFALQMKGLSYQLIPASGFFPDGDRPVRRGPCREISRRRAQVECAGPGHGPRRDHLRDPPAAAGLAVRARLPQPAAGGRRARGLRIRALRHVCIR